MCVCVCVCVCIPIGVNRPDLGGTVPLLGYIRPAVPLYTRFVTLYAATHLHVYHVYTALSMRTRVVWRKHATVGLNMLQ